MLTKLLQFVFVPKSARAKLAEKSAKQAAVPRRAPGRDKLLDDTMALYRRQRTDVYESLDEETRRQIEADAEKTFGDALRAKR
jgi:hypothetical protein